MAGMDMLTVQSRQIHAGQALVRVRANRNANDLIDEEMSFGQRIADHVAQFGGSWTFIILFGVVLISYTAINHFLHGKAWDPYPFILLNLFLSMLAAIQAPVIMMSQNRQDSKDRVRSELDYEVNRRAEAEIQALAAKVHLLTDKVDDLDESAAAADAIRLEVSGGYGAGLAAFALPCRGSARLPGVLRRAVLEFLKRERGVALFEEQVAELFAGGNDGAWGYGELLNGVFLIGCGAEQGDSLIGPAGCLR